LSGGDDYKTAARTVNARLKICLQFLFFEHDQRPLGCRWVSPGKAAQKRRTPKRKRETRSDNPGLHPPGFAN
jgi:hypothetical protein